MRCQPAAAALASLALTFAGAGCLWRRVAPYDLAPGTGGTVLVPPRKSASGKPVRLGLKLDDVAGCAALHGAFAAPELGLTWTLADRRLSATLAPAINQFGAREPVKLLQGIQELRDTLAGASARGCLTPARARRLLEQAVESLPLTPATAQVLLLGAYTTARYLDVTGPVELALSYADDPRQPARYDLGWVERVYRFEPRSADGRGQLAEVSRAAHGPGRRKPAPPPVALDAMRQAAFYRLFFYLRRSASDHDVALVAAPSRSALDAATHTLLARPGGCQTELAGGALCLLVPPDVTLEARVRVTIQGRPVAVPLPATVRMALSAGGVRSPSSVLATLRVWRPYRGGLAPVAAPAGDRQLLLGLVLVGGERITW
ncbi:MAG: hypothetical protein ACRD01_12325 [Terriglobales bacterium]